MSCVLLANGSQIAFSCGISKMVGYTVIQIKILPEGLGASETPSADATWRGGRPELLGFFPWPWLPGRFFSVPSQNTCSVFFFDWNFSLSIGVLLVSLYQDSLGKERLKFFC